MLELNWLFIGCCILLAVFLLLIVLLTINAGRCSTCKYHKNSGYCRKLLCKKGGNDWCLLYKFDTLEPEVLDCEIVNFQKEKARVK